MNAEATSVNARYARNSFPGVAPAGISNGASTLAMNNTEISGNPRCTSMNPVHTTRKNGNRDRRPSANNTPSGNPRAKAKLASNTVNGNPLHDSEGTSANPNPPPKTQTTTASTTGQANSSRTPQNRGTKLPPINPSNNTKANAGRHRNSPG